MLDRSDSRSDNKMLPVLLPFHIVVARTCLFLAVWHSKACDTHGPACLHSGTTLRISCCFVKKGGSEACRGECNPQKDTQKLHRKNSCTSSSTGRNGKGNAHAPSRNPSPHHWPASGHKNCMRGIDAPGEGGGAVEETRPLCVTLTDRPVIVR